MRAVPDDTLLMACDHGGLGLKGQLVEHLRLHHPELALRDLGVDSAESTDYPDWAAMLCRELLQGAGRRGILLCGSGIGIAMAANRFRGIRAALCHDECTARLAREHNDANVLVLGGRTTGYLVALGILEVWLSTPFAGGHHQYRIDLLDQLP